MARQKEYHKSDRIATAMCDAAGSDAEHAGMAVYTPHGGRGRSAAGRIASALKIYPEVRSAR